MIAFPLCVIVPHGLAAPRGAGDAQCHEEQVAMAEALSRIGDYLRDEFADPPGRDIMNGPFHAWPFNTSGSWRKYAIRSIHHASVNNGAPGQFWRRRMEIEIHYMVEMKTKVVRQIKFKSTVKENCEGVLERVGGGRGQPISAPAETFGGLMPPARRGEVIVGPVTPHQGAPAGVSCAACHNGQISGSKRAPRLKTPTHHLESVSKGRGDASTAAADGDTSPEADLHRLIASFEPQVRGRIIDSLL
ncbi:hypothetical protein [Mitsuaria sp. GD03876]|uniref:hypothetical protein n=1 Tax=Mitsuaria sp. GD03876 TaxID=2975399 RepID=UPI00244773E9|nr:hypothetical protein [Mitsuaria sp. GD03876]MDH0865567.1 hypothetical protein [Mitsuaria sp. GD03876]